MAVDGEQPDTSPIQTKEYMNSPLPQTHQILPPRLVLLKRRNTEVRHLAVVPGPIVGRNRILDDVLARARSLQLWRISEAADDGHLCDRGDGRAAECAEGVWRTAKERGGHTSGKHGCGWELSGDARRMERARVDVGGLA